MSTMTSPSAGYAPSVNGWNAEYLQQQYDNYKADPLSVPPDLCSFFQGFDLALSTAGAGVGSSSLGASGGVPALQLAADELTNAFREQGHQAARIDPLNQPVTLPSRLDPASHGIKPDDLNSSVRTSVIPGKSSATVAELIARLREVYCSTIGLEFTHIPDPHERLWFLAKFEQAPRVVNLSAADRAVVLKQLTQAESLDKFLGKRYQGKKRFSLEGGESLIPFLKWMTQRAGELGTEEVILGMAHRGRLAVLKNYMGKDLTKLFTEFEDSWSDPKNLHGGDVKYHRGYSGDQELPSGGKVHLSLLNNPSHLESVNPLVMGRCRAKQDRVGDRDRRKIISLLIHGDAAVAGQGVIAECLTMSQLDGYTVGGTIHVVINNQVGFTTDPRDARSTRYCTDIAKMVNCPVLHVNGDDPEAVAVAAQIAAEYRHEFRKDVFVDIVCFRRFGHNEQDEPTYTQPRLYANVKQHPGTLELYRRELVAEGVVSEAQAQALVDEEFNALDQAQVAAKQKAVNPVPPPGEGGWKGIQGSYSLKSPATAIKPAVVEKICAALGRVPEGFNLNAKLKGLLQARASLPQTQKLSHADAELLAFGSLLLDGYNVRLSGQDCRRGTFTQRHAVLRDEQTDERYTPLNAITSDQKARLEVFDSPLSEYGVMGFDYGYSRGAPRSLVLWEGQFGDFVNGAQIVIDQYLASSEVKWQRWAGLVLLLPHGYEGQGPEHSSARLERFLQLCAEENMEVCYPSTGAQHFHMLRRQMLRDFRKPLIVMTPKKFLRVETATVAELSEGAFQHLIDDPTITTAAQAKGVKKVLYCSGKVYHELNERRIASGKTDVAIVRLEQLYPLHAELLKKIDAKYPSSAKRFWVQEEPRNQGAYLYAADAFREMAKIEMGYIGRPACASPATGSEYAHKKTQELILSEAVAPAPKGKDEPAAKGGGSAKGK